MPWQTRNLKKRCWLASLTTLEDRGPKPYKQIVRNPKPEKKHVWIDEPKPLKYMPKEENVSLQTLNLTNKNETWGGKPEKQKIGAKPQTLKAQILAGKPETLRGCWLATPKPDKAIVGNKPQPQTKKTWVSKP